jgi:hypothetical protein
MELGDSAGTIRSGREAMTMLGKANQVLYWRAAIKKGTIEICHRFIHVRLIETHSIWQLRTSDG